MDLVHQVAANLEIDAGKAEKGIGAILMALRMNLDGDTFKAVKHVLEHLRSAHRDGQARDVSPGSAGTALIDVDARTLFTS